MSRRASAPGTPGVKSWLGPSGKQRILVLKTLKLTHFNYPVELSWPSQRRVNSVRPVSNSDDHDSSFHALQLLRQLSAFSLPDRCVSPPLPLRGLHHPPSHQEW